MKDGIKLFPDDDSGVLPMDQWTWKYPDNSEPKPKAQKGKKRQMVKPPTGTKEEMEKYHKSAYFLLYSGR